MTVGLCQSPGTTPCLDYEEKQRYDLAVRAVDNLGLPISNAGTASLIVNVQDVNDNRPIFAHPYVRYIREGDVVTTDELLLMVRSPFSLLFAVNG